MRGGDCGGTPRRTSCTLSGCRRSRQRSRWAFFSSLLDPYAGHPVAVPELAKLWHALLALLDGDGAAGVEDAAGGRVEGTRHLPPKHGALARQLHGRVRNGHGREQRLGVGVLGVLVEGLPVG